MTCQNASPILRKTLAEAHETLEDVNVKLQSVESYSAKIGEKISKYTKIHENISSNLEKIDALEHLVEYYRVLEDIQSISAELTSCINSKEDHKIVSLFISLSGSSDSDSVIGRLQDVDAPHMKLYARRMALYWHDIIKEKLSR